MAGIYIHIPFCKQACHYCDFHFSTNIANRQELILSLAQEINLQKNYLEQDTIHTIYFGGGTPSLLSKEELAFILLQIQTHFSIGNNVEITLEANPDDLTSANLIDFKSIGINRLSIGIQSFKDRILGFLNRAHDSVSALSCVPLARQAGFSNISIDLIYSIPGQNEDEWIDNIKKAIELNPEHISAYSLTIEEKTVFGKWSAVGKLKGVEDDFTARQLEILVDELEKAGYEQYEISNFSKPGYQSQHNSSYWKGLKYLGIGPSAHSYNLVSRQYNIQNNHQYVRSLNAGKVPFELEILSSENHINEYLLTTLRTRWGTDLAKLKHEFHYDVLSTHKAFISDLQKRGHVIIENNFLILTRSGRLLADKISSDLFLVS